MNLEFNASRKFTLPKGFEPLTYSLEGYCTILLCYREKFGTHVKKIKKVCLIIDIPVDRPHVPMADCHSHDVTHTDWTSNDLN